MKKRFPRFQILFIGGIFFLLGTNFLAILFPNNNQDHKNCWYSSVGFELVSSAYADDDEDDREDYGDRRRDGENENDHEDDREEDHDNDSDREDHDDENDDYYYTPPITQPPADSTLPTNPPTSSCRTVYDTVTSASGVSSQVPRQVCDTTTPVVPPVQTPVTPPVQTPAPTVPPITQPPADSTLPTNPPTDNCRTVYSTVYDTVTTASGTQVQEPRQVSKQVCDTTTPVTPVVTPEKVVTPPAPVVPAKPIIQKNPPAPITGIYKNGTYLGDGYYLYAGGSVTYTVSLTLESSKITEAHFLAFTPSGNGKYTRADGDATLATLVRLQNTSIDTVTWATGTSKAIQDAINVALRKAKWENVTTNPPIVQENTIPKPATLPVVQPTFIQGSDEVTPIYIPDSQTEIVSPDILETILVSGDESTIVADSLSPDTSSSSQENEVIPTSRLVERIATKDGKSYSIIKNLESGKYILLDEKNGERDPHTFQFKEDVIAYATASQEAPQTFIERIFQFFASLFSESSEAPVAAESPVITKTQLLAQADLQTRTMKQKLLKQKAAEAIAQFEMQNAQKSVAASVITTQKKTVPVTKKTVQVAPKKAVASVATSAPAQKKTVVNTVTQAS